MHEPTARKYCLGAQTWIPQELTILLHRYGVLRHDFGAVFIRTIMIPFWMRNY